MKLMFVDRNTRDVRRPSVVRYSAVARVQLNATPRSYIMAMHSATFKLAAALRKIPLAPTGKFSR